ncbi:MAG: hypothetical protein WA964_09635 [Ilumatobacter sp.]|uniref:hypothetical protein n=1 Tax=Ilumatobacter sp. TaxID=1967498 RepID=UPI003C762B6B
MTRFRSLGVCLSASLLVACGASTGTSVSPSTTSTDTSESTTTTSAAASTSTVAPPVSIPPVSNAPDTTAVPSDVERATTPDLEPTEEPAPTITDDAVPGTDPELTESTSPAGPPNTIHDPLTVEGQLEQTMLSYFTSFVGCLDQLPACDPSPVTMGMHPDFAVPTIRNIERWNGQGALARKTNTFLYEFIEVEAFTEDGLEASVLVCTSTEVEIYVPGFNDITDPANSEDIIFGFPESRISRYALFEIDGAWQIVARRTDEEVFGEGKTVCSDDATSLVEP